MLRDICRDIKHNDDWVVESTDDGIHRAREPGYAFISDHILLEVRIIRFGFIFEIRIKIGWAYIQL